MSMNKSKMLNGLILLSFILQPLYSPNAQAESIKNLKRGDIVPVDENTDLKVLRNNNRFKGKYQEAPKYKTLDVYSRKGTTSSGDVDPKSAKTTGVDGETTYLPPSKKYSRISPQKNYDKIAALCGGDLDSYIDTNAESVQQLKDDIDASKKKLVDLKKAEQDALSSMYVSCRSKCLDLGMGSVSDAQSCKRTNADICGVLQSGDLEDPRFSVTKKIKDQDDEVTSMCSADAVSKRNAGAGEACAMVLGIKVVDYNTSTDASLKGCADAFSKSTQINDQNCPGFQAWLDAHNAYAAELNNLKGYQADLSGYKNSNCTKVNAVADYENYHPDCLSKLSNKCDKALADAQALLDAYYESGYSNGYCATCDVYGKGNMAAAIISGIGGIAVPLGLGGMQFALGKNAINQYSNMYMQQLQTCATVGIPCPPPSMAGMGIGGSMGFVGMPGMMGGAMGGMNMGYPGMMGGAIGGAMGGAMGGMNPWMNGMVLNANLVMGPQGYNPGYSMMMPYNPMMQGNMMQGQYNMMDIQHQMYANQLRMAEMYNQNMVASQYGGNIYGGGMGGMDPYASMYGNMYGNYNGYSPSYGNMFINASLIGNASTYNPYMYGGMNNSYYPYQQQSSCGGGMQVSIPCGSTTQTPYTTYNQCTNGVNPYGGCL